MIISPGQLINIGLPYLMIKIFPITFQRSAKREGYPWVTFKEHKAQARILTQSLMIITVIMDWNGAQ